MRHWNEVRFAHRPKGGSSECFGIPSTWNPAPSDIVSYRPWRSGWMPDMLYRSFAMVLPYPMPPRFVSGKCAIFRGAPKCFIGRRSPPNTPTLWDSPPGVPKEPKANETPIAAPNEHSVRALGGLGFPSSRVSAPPVARGGTYINIKLGPRITPLHQFQISNSGGAAGPLFHFRFPFRELPHCSLRRHRRSVRFVVDYCSPPCDSDFIGGVVCPVPICSL